MLWSLIRIVIFIAIITAATFFLIEAGSVVKLAFGGREYVFSPLIGVIGLILLMLGVWVCVVLLGLVFAIFKFFNGDETAISRYFTRNRERKGYDALADGLVALAAGEGRTASAKAAKAERLLDRPELTQLVSAQAAELNGDTQKALKHYKSLLENDRTRFVGVRGILKQKLADGDTETALKLAEKAFALQPGHSDTMETLFSLQTGKQEWSGARQTLQAKVKAKALPKDVGRRREAVLSLADARNQIDTGNLPAGKQSVLQANALSPDLVPAAVLAAEMHVLDGNKRAAAKVLKKAWASTPHPDLAAAFAEIEPDETSTARLKRFNALIKANADHPESKMLRAELLLAAENFPEARRALGDLAETAPTTRSLAIMAAIARGEGAEEKVVRGWLSKALSVSRGPQWICSSCNKIHSQWMPQCDNCTGFDTLSWTTPPQSDDLAETTAALPLMSGLLTADDEPEVETAEVVEEQEATVTTS